MVGDCQGDRVVEAKGLWTMIDFKFVLLQHFFCDLLGNPPLLSMQLQAVSIDMARAMKLISTLIACLKDCRTTGDFVDACFTSAAEQCKACNIEMSQPFRLQRVR